MTCNNPLKAYFSNKKYLITIHTRPIQIIKVYFYIFKDYWCTKSITYNFLYRFNTQKVIKGYKFDPHTNEFLAYYNIPIAN